MSDTAEHALQEQAPATLASRHAVDSLDISLGALNAARVKLVQRENTTWRLANTYEADPALAYEVVTGTRQWFDDTSDEEVENLQYSAEDMAVEAIRNGEGGQRIRELVAAGMAFAWLLQSRHEARMAAED